MIAEARAQNVQVALATVPPQRSGGLRHRDAVAATVPGFNDRIRELAAAEKVVAGRRLQWDEGRFVPHRSG